MPSGGKWNCQSSRRPVLLPTPPPPTPQQSEMSPFAAIRQYPLAHLMGVAGGMICGSALFAYRHPDTPVQKFGLCFQWRSSAKARALAASAADVQQ